MIRVIACIVHPRLALRLYSTRLRTWMLRRERLRYERAVK